MTLDGAYEVIATLQQRLADLEARLAFVEARLSQVQAMTTGVVRQTSERQYDYALRQVYRQCPTSYDVPKGDVPPGVDI
jgi:hypothetical protein